MQHLAQSAVSTTDQPESARTLEQMPAWSIRRVPASAGQHTEQARARATILRAAMQCAGSDT